MATVWPIGQTPQIPTRSGVIGSSARRVVPEEGLAGDIVPPSASRRSRRPRSPDPHDGSAPPTPSSETETRTPYPDALLEGAINAPFGPEARDAPIALASLASPTGRGNLNTWLFSHLGVWPGDTRARSPLRSPRRPVSVARVAAFPRPSPDHCRSGQCHGILGARSTPDRWPRRLRPRR